MPSFKDMKSWRDRLGHSGLRSFTDSDTCGWSKMLQRRQNGRNSLGRRMLIDGEIYTASEATKRFMQQKR